jgi:hypothetical protein
MIELHVEDYCHKCPDFDPVLTKLYAGGAVHTIYVQCANKERCNSIKRFLESEKNHEEN